MRPSHKRMFSVQDLQKSLKFFSYSTSLKEVSNPLPTKGWRDSIVRRRAVLLITSVLALLWGKYGKSQTTCLPFFSLASSSCKEPRATRKSWPAISYLLATQLRGSWTSPPLFSLHLIPLRTTLLLWLWFSSDNIPILTPIKQVFTPSLQCLPKTRQPFPC